MKNLLKYSKLFLLLIFICQSTENHGFNSGDKSIDKKYNKMQERADEMSNLGAIAVVGMSVENSSRHDLGRTKAKADAMAKLSEQKEVYVQTVVHDFKQSISNGQNEEFEEVFRAMTKILSDNVLHGARIIEFDCYQTKENKKEGNSTYLVLLVISPQYTFQSINDELSKSNDEKVISIYEKFNSSQGKIDLEAKIESFEKEFGKEFGKDL